MALSRDDIAKQRFGYYEHLLRPRGRRPVQCRSGRGAARLDLAKMLGQHPHNVADMDPLELNEAGEESFQCSNLQDLDEPTVSSPGSPVARSRGKRYPPAANINAGATDPAVDATAATARGEGEAEPLESRDPAWLERRLYWIERRAKRVANPLLCHCKKSTSGAAYASIYYAVGEVRQTPGPGHYDAERPRSRGCSSPAWSHAARARPAKDFSDLDMYNLPSRALGPGGHEPSIVDRSVVEESSPDKKRPAFSSALPTYRLKSGEGKDLPVTAHASPRYIHCAAPDRTAWYDHADEKIINEQALRVRSRGSTTPELDHQCRQPRLTYNSKAWQLGGNLVKPPSGHNAGPWNSMTSQATRYDRSTRVDVPIPVGSFDSAVAIEAGAAGANTTGAAAAGIVAT
eukprot:TRINITY_DN58128_c0_g1_i1.p1 TRINITY_DN58128_c0_g1~~TRINITY_DN58128_c0_g1_i1.p1  ORF type:complete len:428 (+),score=57.86 TRINITY_DN58128_c0_g1_i1:79-1284(+)